MITFGRYLFVDELTLFRRMKADYCVSETDENSSNLDPVHTGPDPYGHHINMTSFKTSMTLKFVIILQNLIKTYHGKSGKSKCDRKVTELNVEITRIRSRVNGVLEI